jgi:hypothetical protein
VNREKNNTCCLKCHKEYNTTVGHKCNSELSLKQIKKR